MAIRIAPGASDLPGDLAGRFLVLVRGSGDPDAALAGLEAAKADLRALGPSMLSPVVLSPEGPLLRVGSLEADDDALHSVPALVAAALERHGVHDALVELLEPAGPLDDLDDTPDAAVLRLFPSPAGADGVVPVEWLEIAAEWVLADTNADEAVAVRLLGASFEVTARDALATLHAAVAARAWCDLVQGDLDQRIRTASLTFGHAPHLALAAGGPACDAAAILARLELLGEVARDVPQVAYACVDLEETFAFVGTGLSGQGWPARGGASPNAVVAQAGDMAVPDAYPLQVLGPAHLVRLGEEHHEPIDGELLDGGRMLVRLGDPIDWLPRYEIREEVLEQGCKTLRDLLVTDAELQELVRGRPEVSPDAPATVRGWLDLDHITIEALPHPRRGLRLTLLELASWLAYEPHSDLPRSVSPVVAAFVRWYASGLDDAERQALKPYAIRLLGTRTPGLAPSPWRPLGVADEARAWLCADWLVRDQAVAWLRAAGHGHIAGRLAKVRPRADGGHRERQLALLDEAAAELAAAADPRADDVAWEAWERAGEATGWVAASEAGWVGIPDAVASAAELRAVEVSRESHDDDAMARSTAIRLAALDAAASEAWRMAGEASASAVDAQIADPSSIERVAPVPLATAWDRAVQGAGARTGRDRDGVELAIEVAEGAARALLGDLIDGGDPPADAMQVARRAAEASPGGEVWSTVREMAHGVLGDEAWEAGEIAAGDVVDRIVHLATPLVDRAVLVAMAREVCGLAARAAIGHGGPDALAPALDTLRPAAVALLDALLDVPS